MYGSSLRMLTRRPRAFRIRPMLAAVIPLPRLLATPPVTKTYFDMGLCSSGVFLMLSKSRPGCESRAGRLGQPVVYDRVEDRILAPEEVSGRKFHRDIRR